MADKDFVVKNSLVVNTAFVVNSTAIYYGTGATNATINATSLILGNSTVNTSLSGSLFRVANSTSSANLNPLSLTIGPTVVNSTMVAVGANVDLTTTSVDVGNTTVNSLMTATLVRVASSTSSANVTASGFNVGSSFANASAIGVGANVVLTATQVLVGNSTVNTFQTATLMSAANSTSSANVTAVGLVTGTSVVNSTAIAAGANVILTTTQVLVGNSTVNSTITATGASIGANSTAAPALFVAANGNIGISNSTPANALRVDGTVSVSGAMFFNNTVTGVVTLSTGNTSISGWANSVTGYFVGGTVVANTSGTYATHLGGDASSLIARRSDTTFIGTTAVALNRASAALTLNGVNISGTASNITAFTINQNVGTGNAPTFTGLTTTGDITTYRTASPTTGVIFLGNAGNRYLFYDGTNYIMPGANLTLNGQTALHAGNYNSYAPTLTGGGASGTWGINITGTAANIRDYTINQSVGTGNSPTFSSVYAQVFYDSNNSAYYIDANSRSRLLALDLDTNNWIRSSNEPWNRIYFETSSSTYILGGTTAQWYIRFGTSNDGTTRSIMEGGGNFYTNGNVVAYWSDRRLKKNITKISDWRDILFKLNGYRYEWNDTGKKILDDPNENDGVKVGLIAQEVQEALPQAAAVQMMQYKDNKDGVLIPKDDIGYDPENPYLTVREEKLIPVLVEALKAAHERIDALEAMIKKN